MTNIDLFIMKMFSNLFEKQKSEIIPTYSNHLML